MIDVPMENIRTMCQVKFRFAILMFLLAGCGKAPAPPPPIVEVEGVVLLDGKPLKNVEVRFVPVVECGSDYVARATTNVKGEFRLLCNNGQPGACECENRVLILEGPLPAADRGASQEARERQRKFRESLENRPLPQEYASLVTSPLVLKVEAGKKTYTIELTRKASQ